MNVLHLVAGELGGGAARGAYWLHQALRELGVDSMILTNAKDNLGDSSVISLAESALGKLKFAVQRRMGQLPLKLYPNRRPTAFNTGINGVDFTRHPAYAAADLVHLHWVNGLVSNAGLRRVKKPVVWTLRDMWPLTGGCHYSLGCDRFTKDCGCCPQLNSTLERDLTRFALIRKKASVPKHIRVIGISRWMSSQARQSARFRDCEVSTISNNIDTALFTPVDRVRARRALGLEDDRKIVLVGALHVASVYKGFDLFLEALRQLQSEKLHLVTFGNSSAPISESLGIPITNLGFLSDAIALRLAYSAADVFVAPSRVEAFGKTLVEAMSCGTPVVSFNATGPKDIVEHRVNGYLAEPFSAEDLAHGIAWVLAQPVDAHVDLCNKRACACARSFRLACHRNGVPGAIRGLAGTRLNMTIDRIGNSAGKLLPLQRNTLAVVMLLYGLVMMSPLFAYFGIRGTFLTIALFAFTFVVFGAGRIRLSFWFMFLGLAVLVLACAPTFFWMDGRYIVTSMFLLFPLFLLQLGDGRVLDSFLTLATALMLVLLVGAVIGFILALNGVQPIFEIGNSNGRPNYFFYTTFSVVRWGNVIRPSGIYDEPGAFSFMVCAVAALRHLRGRDARVTWLMLAMGFVTLSLAHLVYVLIHAMAEKLRFRNVVGIVATLLPLILIAGYLGGFQIVEKRLLSRATITEAGEIVGDNRSWRMINAADQYAQKSGVDLVRRRSVLPF